MLSPFRYMKEVIHHVFSNCRKTKCIKSNRRSDWSTGTRRRIFNDEHYPFTDYEGTCVWGCDAFDEYFDLFANEDEFED